MIALILPGCGSRAIDSGAELPPRDIQPFEQQFLAEKFDIVKQGEKLPADVQEYLQSRLGVLMDSESSSRFIYGGSNDDFAFAFTELEGAVTYHTLTIFIYDKAFTESVCKYALTRIPRFSDLKNIFQSNKHVINSECKSKQSA